jgi:cytochrome o ubiquinol oxidase subunit IV
MDETKMGAAVSGGSKVRPYIIGFVLSVILTLIPFALVMGRAYPRRLVVAGIVGAALVQAGVHLRCFLHLDASPSACWNNLALLVTLLIIILFVGGSLWIMYNLNYRMM